MFRLLTERDEEQRVIERQRAVELKKMIEGPSEWLRRIDPVGEQMEKLRREMLGPSVLGQLMGTPAIGAELTRLQAQTLAQAEEINRAIDRAAGVGHFYTSALRQHELLATQLGDRASMLSQAKDALGSMIGTSGAVDRFLKEEMTRQKAWGDSIRQFLNPGLSSGLLASMIGAQAHMTVSEAIEAAAGLSRGFRTTANVGLAGVGPRGAAAEVLRRYRAESSDHSDLFGEVMGGIQRFDAEDFNGEELSEDLNKACSTARRFDLTDPLQAPLARA